MYENSSDLKKIVWIVWKVLNTFPIYLIGSFEVEKDRLSQLNVQKISIERGKGEI